MKESFLEDKWIVTSFEIRSSWNDYDEETTPNDDGGI